MEAQIDAKEVVIELLNRNYEITSHNTCVGDSSGIFVFRTIGTLPSSSAKRSYNFSYKRYIGWREKDIVETIEQEYADLDSFFKKYANRIRIEG